MKKITLIISTLFLFTCEDSVADLLLDCKCDTVEYKKSIATNDQWEELSRIEIFDDAYLALCSDSTIAEWTTKDDEDRDVLRKTVIDCDIESTL